MIIIIFIVVNCSWVMTKLCYTWLKTFS